MIKIASEVVVWIIYMNMKNLTDINNTAEMYFVQESSYDCSRNII